MSAWDRELYERRSDIVLWDMPTADSRNIAECVRIVETREKAVVLTYQVAVSERFADDVKPMMERQVHDEKIGLMSQMPAYMQSLRHSMERQEAAQRVVHQLRGENLKLSEPRRSENRLQEHGSGI